MKDSKLLNVSVNCYSVDTFGIRILILSHNIHQLVSSLDCTYISQESCRFIDNANQVVTSLGKVITNFHDETGLKQAFGEYENAHCPYRNDKSASKQYHHKVRILAPKYKIKK